MKRYRAKVLALAVAVWTAPAGFGGVIMQPTAISSPQGSLNSVGYELTQILNQSGLSVGYTSSVTDFATYLGSATHDSGGGTTTNTGFTNTAGGFPQQITFDLGSVFSISGLGFWATSNIGSVTQFRLFTDTDGNPNNGVSAQLGGTFNALANGGTASAGQVFSFGSTSTQFVHLYVDNTAGGTGMYPGVGEVAFDADVVENPEPATMALVLMGLAGIALRRKR
jgi:hypothetical protein